MENRGTLEYVWCPSLRIHEPQLFDLDINSIHRGLQSTFLHNGGLELERQSEAQCPGMMDTENVRCIDGKMDIGPPGLASL